MGRLITAFLGPAGTGKTHSLVAHAVDKCEGRRVTDGQSVLGLSFMHGSRRRMAHRVGELRAIGVSCRVETLDSFALSIVRRFRRHCGVPGSIYPGAHGGPGWEFIDDSYRASWDTIRTEAARLLAESAAVRAWVEMTHPLVLIDEAQDCDEALLDLLQAIAECSELVCAADPFQAINHDYEACPAVEWLQSVADVRVLSLQRRTAVSGLLRSASALREGTARTGGVSVLCPKGAALGSYEIQLRIQRGWRGEIALLSPVGPGTSAWVDGVVRYLHNSKKSGAIRPYPFPWEQSAEQRAGVHLRTLLSPYGELQLISLSMLQEVRDADCFSSAQRRIAQSLARRLRIAGRTEIRRENLEQDVLSRVQAARASDVVSERQFRLAMTIHGAKNREFDYVFVLWPYNVPSGTVRQRKLLYNAVTRARKDAVVIVQGGVDRVRNDPVLSLLG